MFHHNAQGQVVTTTGTNTRNIIVFEAALGGELFEFIARGAIPENMARMYFKQLIAGIQYMHTNGVYHKDLKFDNILLSETLLLKIADFGLSVHRN